MTATQASNPGISASSRFLRAAIYLAAALFFLGIFAPMLTLTKFIFIRDRISLVTGLSRLLEEGDLLLFIIIFVFSIMFPVAKLVILHRIVSIPSDGARFGRHIAFLSKFGKWSMLDVFVVAVLLASVKLGALADVELHFGIYAFAASVLLSMCVTMRIESGFPGSGIGRQTTLLDEPDRFPPML